MARTGIQYSDVANAATQLLGQGRNPTVEQVRLILGTGSSTTIANHLRQWKANQESTDLIFAKDNLPPELIALMKGLWERVINLSEEKIISIKEGYEQTISELTLAVEKYKTNNQRWQKMYNQWLTEKNQLQDQIKLLNHEKWQIAQEKSQLEGRLQQLQEMTS